VSRRKKSPFFAFLEAEKTRKKAEKMRKNAKKGGKLAPESSLFNGLCRNLEKK